ncbi:MAG: ATP-binding cassette domain-containing protein [Sporomusaceae bacterium]|jgi:Fe-S cluster assembly ATP-binding protein|nr:ATP-binding cassette domain-containing protein [Sporomusaceae bacterium]
MLEMQNVSVELDGEKGKVQVLKDISLTLEKKKIYAIKGPNGGGKSSIAKAIMGIYQPTGGKIFLDGIDITNMSITERARLGIGYSFQEPPRFKGIKVRELIRLAAGVDDDRKVDMVDLLYDVGLCSPYYINRENMSFSGGELKRIELACTLARNLKVAIFDEPDSGIDLWCLQKIQESLKKVHKTRDTTIVIISHNQHVMKMADHVLLVANGKHRQDKEVKHKKEYHIWGVTTPNLK